MFNSTKSVYDLNKLKIKDSNRLLNLPITEIILHHKNLEI